MPYKIIINTALEKFLGNILGRKQLSAFLVAIEFTTCGQSPMRASICFASITVVLSNKIKEKYVSNMGKVNIAFSLKQR